MVWGTHLSLNCGTCFRVRISTQGPLITLIVLWVSVKRFRAGLACWSMDGLEWGSEKLDLEWELEQVFSRPKRSKTLVMWIWTKQLLTLVKREQVRRAGIISYGDKVGMGRLGNLQKPWSETLTWFRSCSKQIGFWVLVNDNWLGSGGWKTFLKSVFEMQICSLWGVIH